MFSSLGLKVKLKYYLSNVLFIWLAILLYRYNSYYLSFLTHESQEILLLLALAYTVFGFMIYIATPLEKIHESRGYILFKLSKRIASTLFSHFKNSTLKSDKPFFEITREEKNAILFPLVKLFFLPIMVNFVVSNYDSIINVLRGAAAINLKSGLDVFNNLIFPGLLSIIFLIDTSIFAFGYAIESSALKSKVRSIEPTFLGWVVVLLCYPPFNSLLGTYAPGYSNDYATFYLNGITLAVRILIILLYGFYVFATISLGPKSSNLTNRGIVSEGAYSVVRHPAYASKNLVWWITIIPVISIPAVLSMAAVSFVYYLRAMTEERHLMEDPEYQEYCRKVKYRFIPGIY